jgi:hypothetical protein
MYPPQRHQLSSTGKLSSGKGKIPSHHTTQALGLKSSRSTVSPKSIPISLKILPMVSTLEYPPSEKPFHQAITLPSVHYQMLTQRSRRRNSSSVDIWGHFSNMRSRISLDLFSRPHYLSSSSQERPESTGQSTIFHIHMLHYPQFNPSTRQSMQIITLAHMAHSLQSASSSHVCLQVPKYPSEMWLKPTEQSPSNLANGQDLLFVFEVPISLQSTQTTTLVSHQPEVFMVISLMQVPIFLEQMVWGQFRNGWMTTFSFESAKFIYKNTTIRGQHGAERLQKMVDVSMTVVGFGTQEILCQMESLKSLTKIVALLYVSYQEIQARVSLTRAIAMVMSILTFCQAALESNGKTQRQSLGVFRHPTSVLFGTLKIAQFPFQRKRSRNTSQPSKNGSYMPHTPSSKYKDYMESYYTPPWWCQKDEHTSPIWKPCSPP